jgi:hypothetical protein
MLESLMRQVVQLSSRFFVLWMVVVVVVLLRR